MGVGGENPIRIQSMTTSDTRDVEKTIEQIIRLADVGCDIARVTVQGVKEAAACEGIKSGLVSKGYEIPIVADIHFYPPAALQVVESVDKVRINPGNFADRRASFKKIEYDDASYAAELDRIEDLFSPLVEKCKKLKKALRIGTNHGSLSDRIMNRYGDTPFGMVESALEYTRICRKLDFHDIIFSMKASNPLVMIQAYRLLVAEMMTLGWDYPLHLGVTEAGEGEDGRVKSAMGIGALLLDGIGDTIRISLTEDPWAEIDPCSRLIRFAESYMGKGISPFEERFRDFKKIERRAVSLPPLLHRDGSVLLKTEAVEDVASIGCKEELGRVLKTKNSVDGLIVPKSIDHLEKAGIGMITDPVYIKQASEIDHLPSLPSILFFKPSTSRLHEGRKLFEALRAKKIEVPVILCFDYDCSKEDLIIHAATECGALLSDGLGEGICLSGPYDLKDLKELSFNILQAARLRTFKTEFISCPGCGRTLFELQEVTRLIREQTAHLPGVKIAIMGCIVNGPGEMADADFGYVGSKRGKIDLYVGKTCVERDIEFSLAVPKLVELIKAHGRWVEPEPELVGTN